MCTYYENIAAMKDGLTITDMKNMYVPVKSMIPLLPLSLHPKQEKSIFTVLKGQDLLCCLPTGSGKTLAMVLPAVFTSCVVKNDAQNLTTLIISPLESLMNEMKERINAMGLICECFSKANYNEGRFKEASNRNGLKYFIFSPEVFTKDSTKFIFGKINVYLIAIDEGHCVSLWGCDDHVSPAFRKSYKSLYVLRCFAPTACMAVYTATLTQEMVKDVKQYTCLQPDKLVEVILPPNRPNIFIDMRPASCDLSNLNFLMDEIAPRLNPKNKAFKPLTLEPYFAQYTGCSGMSKAMVQTKFSSDESPIRVLICTIAFGMGLDIKDISRVVIWGTPCDMVSLWQEVGRCARAEGSGVAIIFPFRGNVRSNKLVSFLNDTCCRNYIIQSFYMCRKFIVTHHTCVQKCEGSVCNCSYCNCCTYCKKKCPCLRKD